MSEEADAKAARAAYPRAVRTDATAGEGISIRRPPGPAALRAAGKTLLQIGEVADLIGLSLRTIRHYEEMGVVIPSERSRGGFRLYSPADVDRLRLVMQMKPLDFSLDEMRDLLTTLDTLQSETHPSRRKVALDRLAWYGDQVEKRWRQLQERLAIADDFRGYLRRELHERAAEPVGEPDATVDNSGKSQRGDRR